MANYTPSPYSVFNEFDRFGLLLGLPRLREEKNADYKRRLMDVMVHRADATYLGLIYGITRELGLDLSHAMTIIPEVDGNGDTLLPQPAVVFEGTFCKLYSDRGNNTLLQTLERFDTGSESYTLEDLAAQINSTGYWTATLGSAANPLNRSMTIFEQSSIIQIVAEDISEQAARIKLRHQNLIAGTVSITSDNLNRRVYNEADLRKQGDYLLDLPNGQIFSVGAPAPGSYIRYKYRDDEFKVMASPVILHNIRSEDFQSKMFDQVIEDGTTVNGLPTPLGADIINELLSVFPFTWGE